MYPGDGWERELLTAEKLHQHVLTQVLPDTREVLFLLRYSLTLERFFFYLLQYSLTQVRFCFTSVFLNTRKVRSYSVIPKHLRVFFLAQVIPNLSIGPKTTKKKLYSK